MELAGIAIRPLVADEIERLMRAPWSSGLREKHQQRFARQQGGEMLYLVAWRADVPIGHLLIKWSGPGDERVAAMIADCAEIEDFAVVPELRSRGIGRAMLGAAADLARRRGFRRLGLSVGLDNPRARALYERVGFADAGCGVVTVRWQGPDREGRNRWYEERCTYLVKGLSRRDPRP